MTATKLLARFCEIAANPAAQRDAYLAAGKKVVLTAPVYTPEEVIHSMGLVPMGAWGADTALEGAKRYFPAFICSIVQSAVELGMRGAYRGCSAIVIPSLCDSLKVMGQNWKYAVPDIPFIPMTYPQNREASFGRAFTEAGCRRIAEELERVTGAEYSDEALTRSIEIYNRHNDAMRRVGRVMAEHGEITASERSAVYKSAWFMLKEEHTALVEELIDALNAQEAAKGGIKLMTTGVLADAPGLLKLLDENGMRIVADDVAAESRQYRTDAPDAATPMARLAAKFAAMGNCSVLYDAEKTRVGMIAAESRAAGSDAVLVVQTKFCDPEEFDYPLIKRACAEAGMPCALIELDRQMVNFEQARTAIETLKAMIEERAI